MNELYHYGVPGMKWGVVKKVYSTISNNGTRALQKKSDKYANKAARAKANGHKIQSTYYRNKSYKLQDRGYDEAKAFLAGCRDLQVKAESIAVAANIGKNIVKSVIESNNRKLAEREIREWNRKQFGIMR